MRNIIAIGFVLCVALPIMSARAQPELPALKVERNVIYGMYSGLALLMDIYHPANPNGYGIVHISGSGWKRPLDYDAKRITQSGHVEIEGGALVKAGYTLFTINHRATPRFLYPAAVEDVQRAVRFIRYHAETYGIDPERIGAVGGSSGGHLVSMLGLLDGKGDPEDESPINRVSAKVQCVVARATPASFLEGRYSSFVGLEENKIKDTESAAYKRAREASPIMHVSPDDPPFLLMHGDKDEVVPFKMSEMLEDLLRKANVPVKLVRVKGAGHGASFKGAVNPPDLDKERVQWFDTHLRRK